MMARRTFLAMMATAAVQRNAASLELDREPVSLRDAVRSGALPPIHDRLPTVPRVIPLSEHEKIVGQLGGRIRILVASQRDIRYVPIFSYCRLVGFDRELKLQPDILRDFQVEGQRVFTFHLRPGHRWSDGSPFTAADFQYVWEDMFHNRELYKGGMPNVLRVNGTEPVFEVLDDVTVRYSWQYPNPDFLLEIASPVGTRLMQPSAYMKQFHPKYQTLDKLAQLIKEQGVEDWVSLHQKMSRSARPENPDLPTLDPWRNTVAPPSGYFVFERNPFFHRVDPNGQQLPYVDQLTLTVGSGDLISAKTAAGESDLQVTNLDFSDYTFLKGAEARGFIKVDLWKRTQGARTAIIPNLNCKDLVWQKVFRDVRVRRALSLAVNRQEINNAVFFGLAQVSANAVLPDSPLFRPRYRDAWAAFDLDQANKLLDDAGLAWETATGLRRLPDGRPCELIVETTAESTFETDVLELLTDHWSHIGFKIYSHVAHRELFRQKIMSGETLISLWTGIDNGVPTADMSPRELAPTSNEQIQWPLWGLHELSGGSEGRPPEIKEAQQLLDLFHTWRSSDSFEGRTNVWHEMLDLFTDQVFTIGIVNSVLQPVVKNRRLRNLPPDGLYGFDPTGYLGVYLPDTFWLDGNA